MAYPIRLFDFQTEEGQQQGSEFLRDLDQELGSVFAGFNPNKNKDNMKLYHKWDLLPDFLKTLAEANVEKILQKLPEGEMKWRGSVGVYGRKRGTIIKKDEKLLYRIIIHLGETEVYYMTGNHLNNEPAVLPTGYALLCSPVMIDNVDIKVKAEPFRKNMNSKLEKLVSKIRGRDYLRTTIVLDLPEEGLSFVNDEVDKDDNKNNEP